MLPTVLIFFRESLEASLIVGIILAYLTRIGRNDLARPVWWGISAALALDLGIALSTYHLIRSYDGSRVQTILEGTTYLIATGMLTYMSFWMKHQSRTMKAALETQIQAAVTSGSVMALVLLSALTVGREGLETVFFTLAIAFHSNTLSMAAGAALGLILGISVTYAMNHLGRRVPLSVFFNVLGILLLFFGAGLLADGIEDFQALGWLPFLGQVLWHSQHWLSENSTLGDILHSFFGYADTPTVLQVGSYVSFLALTLFRYTHGNHRSKRPAPPAVG